MKRSLLFTALLAGLLALYGCSKDYAEIPQYGNIVVSPNPIPGEVFTPQVQVIESGDGFYKGEFTVIVTKNGQKVIDKVVNVLDPTEKNPIELKNQQFILTEKGTYNISCSVKLKASKMMESGQVYASPAIGSSTFMVE